MNEGRIDFVRFALVAIFCCRGNMLVANHSTPMIWDAVGSNGANHSWIENPVVTATSNL